MKRYNKTIWIAVGAALVLVAGLSVYFLIDSPFVDEGREAVELEERRHARDGDELSQDGTRTQSITGLERLVEGAEVATPRVMLAQYRLIYRYPPFSRPLTKKMVDLLNPFAVDQEKTPVLGSGAEGKPALFYSWTAPTYMITGSKPAVARLEVFDAASGARVRPRILAAEMISDPIFGERPAGTVAYNDSGAAPDETANDGIYTFTWKPNAGERLHRGELTMKVRFDAAGVSSAEAMLGFHSTPAVPAEFTGNFSERVENGSLFISVELDVRQPGKYVIEGNLIAKDNGEPYHWVYVKPYLERGSQIVDLEFFGAVFHDRDFEEGHLVLRNLRGHRLNLPYDPRKLDAMIAAGQEVPTTSEPLQEWIPPAGDFVTRKSYSVLSFSKDEYQGNDKEERLAVIRQYARDWERAHGSGPETLVEE